MNDVNESTKVNYLPIADDQIFETLWKAGLFREINLHCKSSLDDYEEEMFEASNAPGVMAAIESAANSPDVQQLEVARFLSDARDLIDEASRLARPILFVL